MKRDRPKQASYVERHLGGGGGGAGVSVQRDDDKFESYGNQGNIRRSQNDCNNSNAPPIVPKKPNPSASNVPVSRVRQEPEFKAKKSNKAVAAGSPEGGKIARYINLDDIPDIDDALSPSAKPYKPVIVASNRNIPAQSYHNRDEYDDYEQEEEEEAELKYIQQYPQRASQAPNISHVKLPVKKQPARNDDWDDDDDYSGSSGKKTGKVPQQQQPQQRQPQIQANNRLNSYSPVQTDVVDHKFSEPYAKPQKPAVAAVSKSAKPQASMFSRPRQQQAAEYDDFDNDGDDYDSPPRVSKYDMVESKDNSSKKLPAFPAEQQLAAKNKNSQKPQPVSSAVIASSSSVQQRVDKQQVQSQVVQRPPAQAVMQSQNYIEQRALVNDPNGKNYNNGKYGKVGDSVDSGSPSSPSQKNYKPYTLDQYRQIRTKEYSEIPKLKPGIACFVKIFVIIYLNLNLTARVDLTRDDLVAKRANADRIKEFSKQLQEFNSQVSQNQRKLPSATEQNDLVVAKGKQESKRERAAQFAKQIPKPKLEGVGRRKSYGDEPTRKLGDGYDGMVGEYGGDENMMDYFDEENYYGAAGARNHHQHHHAAEPSKLEQLQAKHAQSKRQVDAIKASIGMK
jgi:hypothetical protein